MVDVLTALGIDTTIVEELDAPVPELHAGEEAPDGPEDDTDAMGFGN